MGITVSIYLMCLMHCILVAHGGDPKPIVGGTLARIEDYPHLVSIRLWKMHACSGSIIDETHILTCAHCVVHFNSFLAKVDMQVLSGTNSLYDNTTDGQIHEVVMVITHPNYNEIMHQNDIAILKLARPIFFTNSRKPIGLSTGGIPNRSVVRLGGWGATDFTDEDSEYLRELSLFFITNEQCRNLLGNMMIKRKHLCALAFPGKNLANGDSGSALVYRNRIIGISSAVVCCGANFPILFTRVYPYVSWIRETVERY